MCKVNFPLIHDLYPLSQDIKNKFKIIKINPKTSKAQLVLVQWEGFFHIAKNINNEKAS